jgi:prepilin-type N-terminal cleavage/methylation domain-containing protein
MHRHARSTHSPRLRGRRGFTIVELLVAIMVFSVGVLALAGTSASIVSMSGNANRRVQAASLASSRFEALRSLSCGTLANGTATSRGIAYSWTVKKFPTTAPRAVEATITVTVPERRGPKVYFFRNVFPC